MFDIITIGGATRDITFLTDKGRVIETPENLTEQRLLGFEYGAKIRSEKIQMNFGGGACNAAATFVKMGLEAAVCTKIGGDENGKSILENLRAKGINTDLVQKDEALHSGFSFIVVNSNGQGERVIFVHKGACNDLEIIPEGIKNTKWIYLSALVGDWEKSLETIFQVVKDNEIRITWNPGESEIQSGREGLADFIKFTDILIINKDEAIELVKGDRDTANLTNEELNDIEKLIEIIKSWGAGMVVVTDGKNGAYVSAADRIVKAPAFIREQVDMTGAGDAFGSGLLAGYILTDDIETGLKFGILNSGSAVSEYGAQNGIMTREDAENNLSAIEVERIK